jgi:hypothetical protein
MLIRDSQTQFLHILLRSLRDETREQMWTKFLFEVHFTHFVRSTHKIRQEVCIHKWVHSGSDDVKKLGTRMSMII